MALATASDLLTRYDARVLGEYAGDSGTVVSPGSLPGNTRVLAALDDASAMVRAALNKSRKYAEADLVAAGSLVTRIVCDLAAGLILEARMLPQDQVGQLVPRYAEARKWLDDLAVGYAVLPISANLDAGLPSAGTVPPKVATTNHMFGFWPLSPWQVSNSDAYYC